MNTQAPIDSTNQLLKANELWTSVDADFARIWRTAKDITGWLSENQAAILYRAASTVPDGRWIVEIGSHHGRSTVFLATAKGAEVQMLAIDPFDDTRWGGGREALEQFQATIARFNLTDRVKPFRGLSAEASAQWDGTDRIGLLFVDGAHDKDSVLADIDGWEKHIAPGGIVAFHDAFSSVGVTQALMMRHLLNCGYYFLGADRSLALFCRANLTHAMAAQSAFRLSAELPYFARNLAVKLALRREWGRFSDLLRYRPGDDLF